MTAAHVIDAGASAAEQRARGVLRQRAEAISAQDLTGTDALPNLIQGVFHDVAQAYSPDDPVALWRFTLPELLLMLEDFAQRLRGTILADFPVLRHVELSWVVTLVGLGGPMGKLLSLYRMLRWINPSSAIAAELRGRIAGEAISGIGDGAKSQIGAMLIVEAGETAIKLYSGGYRRRADELLPTAPTPIPERPNEPLTVLIAGQRNAGKSALLNALLGTAREPVGLLTPTTEGCRPYQFHAEHTGALILVDCPGPGPGPDASTSPAWLEQAGRSDLVLWVAAANRADRAADQQGLASLDALTERRPEQRAIPRILVLTHADKLDPPMEWEPPYDIDHGQRVKEEQMRESREAGCEQLGMTPQHCALIAIRPNQPVWNAEALLQAIAQVLPEARQKQLERGMATDGWFTRVKDVVASVPGASGKTGEIGRRILSRTISKARNKVVDR